MTRSQSLRKQGVRGPVIAMLTAAACLGTAQAAQPEKVIFAAENALYGAGHDIGRADGWLDNQLRTAIRAYQREAGLQANGNLDADTLKALGVKVPLGATITANSVGSRTESMKGLGLTIPKPKPVTPKVATAEPEPVQEPAQQADEKSPVQVQSTKKTKPEEAVIQIVTEETSKPLEDESPKKPEVVISEAAEKAPTATQTVKDPVLAQIPTEPTSAGRSEPQTTRTEPSTIEQIDTPAPENQTVADKSRSTGGGFFSALFDFFFGWLV